VVVPPSRLAIHVQEPRYLFGAVEHVLVELPVVVASFPVLHCKDRWCRQTRGSLGLFLLWLGKHASNGGTHLVNARGVNASAEPYRASESASSRSLNGAKDRGSLVLVWQAAFANAHRLCETQLFLQLQGTAQRPPASSTQGRSEVRNLTAVTATSIRISVEVRNSVSIKRSACGLAIAEWRIATSHSIRLHCTERMEVQTTTANERS
jgi:hypothetical protein